MDIKIAFTSLIIVVIIHTIAELTSKNHPPAYILWPLSITFIVSIAVFFLSILHMIWF